MEKLIKHSTVLDLPMYGCKIHIIVTNETKQIINKLYKKFKMGEEFVDEVEGVVISPDMTNYHLVIDLKYLTHNTIAHEIYHAAVRITEDRDIVDEETQAWVAGHIASVMYKFLEKKNLNIKHDS
jgi:hypothetical protein